MAGSAIGERQCGLSGARRRPGLESGRPGKVVPKGRAADPEANRRGTLNWLRTRGRQGPDGETRRVDLVRERPGSGGDVLYSAARMPSSSGRLTRAAAATARLLPISFTTEGTEVL